MAFSLAGGKEEKVAREVKGQGLRAPKSALPSWGPASWALLFIPEPHGLSFPKTGP